MTAVGLGTAGRIRRSVAIGIAALTAAGLILVRHRGFTWPSVLGCGVLCHWLESAYEHQELSALTMTAMMKAVHPPVMRSPRMNPLIAVPAPRWPVAAIWK